MLQLQWKSAAGRLMFIPQNIVPGKVWDSYMQPCVPARTYDDALMWTTVGMCYFALGKRRETMHLFEKGAGRQW